MPSARLDPDVVIVGGGPAGSATALTLRREAPELSVTLLERSRYDAPRIGEVLPGAARRLLEGLEVWADIQQAGFRPVYATAAAWGEPGLRENHGLFSLHGYGWHLDRVRFDALLARQAEAGGTELRCRTRCLWAEPEAEGWRLGLDDGTVLRARLLVDATGRRAALARRAGAKRTANDRLIAYVRYTILRDDSDPRTLVEAFADGWWYTAPLPEARRVIACLTDADLGERLGLNRDSGWQAALAETHWISKVAADGEPAGKLMVRAAGTCGLDRVAGHHWIAVGDAACAYDPLSSQGITKALRSGIFAAYALIDRLRLGSDQGFARYAALHRHGFEGYRQAYRRFYAEEGRWRDSEFWRRRQGG